MICANWSFHIWCTNPTPCQGPWVWRWAGFCEVGLPQANHWCWPVTLSTQNDQNFT